jgi:DNA-binding SARP family transcriptional activator
MSTRNGTSTDRSTRTAEIDRQIEQAWHERSRDDRRSEELARRGIARSGRIGHRRGEARGAITLAYIAMNHGRYAESRTGALAALETARDAGDRLGEARALFVLGVDARFLGEPERGLEYYGDSLRIGEELGDREIETIVHNGLANLFRYLGRHSEGAGHYEQSRRCAAEGGLPDCEARALYGIAVVRMETGDGEGALRLLDECERLARGAGMNSLLPTIMNLRTVIHGSSGNINTMLRHELECLKMMEESENLEGVCSMLAEVADRYMDLGEYDCSLDALLRCMELSRRCGLRNLEAFALIRIGRLLEAIDEGSNVIEYYLRSLRLSQDAGDYDGESMAHFYLGRFHRTQGDPPKAIAYYLKCLQMERRSGQRPGMGSVLQALGGCYADLHEYDEARRYLQESYDMTSAMGDSDGQIRALTAIASLESTLGRHHEAIGQLERALEKARLIEHQELWLHTLQELATEASLLGDERGKRRYERERSDLSQKLFNAESTRRVRTLIARFEGDLAIREGELLGLEEEDLSRVRDAVRKWEGRPRRSAEGNEPSAENAGRINHNGRPSSPAAKAHIGITTFGSFRVMLDGRELGKGAWQRKRARDLFKLLLVHHRAVVTVDEIQEKLWGGITDRQIDMLVMNAASHIRNALALRQEVQESTASLLRVDGGYRLDLGDDSTIDFVRFKELIVAARHSQSVHERRRLYVEAVALYGGDFLPEDLFVEWTDYHRQMLKDAYFEAMEFLAREHLRSGELDQAIEGARSILRHDDTSESAYQVLLVALKERGRIAEARRAFEQCVERFRRDHGVEPPERLREIVEG